MERDRQNGCWEVHDSDADTYETLNKAVYRLAVILVNYIIEGSNDYATHFRMN